jgi:transcriptional regulator with XRE-family HTH domain
MLPIHEKIRLFRIAKGWTQEELADKLELSVNGYGEIERGNSDIKLSRVEQIAGLLGVEIMDLFDTNDRNVFNLGANNGTQYNHYNSAIGTAELQAEIEKLQLIIQLKDKEIELKDEKISHLRDVNKLLGAKDIDV